MPPLHGSRVLALCAAARHACFADSALDSVTRAGCVVGLQGNMGILPMDRTL